MSDIANNLDRAGTQEKTAATAVATKRADDKKRRVKTSGERLFDGATYIGVGIGLNELISIKSFDVFENGLLKPFYDWAKEFSAKAPGISKIDYIGKGRFLRVCVALVGGTIVLLPIKWLEASKASIVGFFDRHIYGVKPEDDATISRLHQEMEKAPKQTWRSLIEGRLVVMAAAFGIDYLIAKPDAITTVPFEKTPLKDYSSLDRMASTIARNTVDFFDPKGAAARLLERDPLNPYDIQKEVKVGEQIVKAGEGKAVRTISNGFYLLTVAVALTVLFYVSSKLFAKNIAKKEDRKEAVARGEIPPDKEVAVDEKSVDAAKPLAQADAQPKTQVSDVERSGQRAKPAASKAVTA